MSGHPKGFAPWNPRRRSREIVAQVQDVLDEYSAQLPLTCRQVFYRLVGAHDYPKDESAYGRLVEKAVRARRAGMILFHSIRDDGTSERWPGGYSGTAGFWRSVRSRAIGYRRDKMADQPVWCEAGDCLYPFAVADAEGDR